MMPLSKICAVLILGLLASCAQHHVEPKVQASVKPHEAKAAPVVKHQQVSVAELSRYNPDFLYLAAHTALEQGHYQQATVFLQALNLHLNASSDKQRWSIEPRVQLAQLWVKLHKAAKAEEVLRPLLAHYPLAKGNDSVLRLYTLHARVLVAQGQVADAVDVLTRVLQVAPDFASARHLQIALLMQTQRWDLVHIAIHSAVQHKDAALLHMWDADAYLQEKKYPQAAAALQRAHTLSPDQAEIVIKQSQLDEQNKQYQQAVTRLRSFLDTYPKQALVQERLAALYLKQGALKPAIGVYQALDQQRPNHVALQLMLGKLFYQEKNLKQAEHYFRKAYQLQPKGDSHAFYLAAVLDVQGEQEKALTLYQQVQPEDTMWVQAQLAWAGIALRHKKYSQVQEKMHALLQQKPEEAHAWVLLSSAYLGEKKYAALLKQTQGGLKLKKPSARLLMNRAIALEHFKRYDEVEQVLQTVLEAYPDDGEALNFLGYTYAEQGVKLHQAKQYIEHALKVKPKDAYYMDSLAWVYYQQGKLSQAIRLQREALALMSDDATMQEHLGDMLWRAGLNNEAVLQWKKALTLHPEFPDKLHKKIVEGL